MQTSAPQAVTVTIAAGQTAPASGVAITGFTNIAVLVPALGTATTVKLQVSADGAAWYDVRDSGGTTLQQASGSGGHAMDADLVTRCVLGWRYVRPVLGAAQASDVLFTLLMS